MSDTYPFEASGQPEYTQFIQEALFRPIPNMDMLRERKKGYHELPIDAAHPLHNEPVVPIALYGLAGQAYYSRPNSVTGSAVPGVPADLFIRQSVAETLAKINKALRQPIITAFFGGEVELYVEDALRTVSLQRQLHDTLIPALLRQNHPEITKAAIEERIKDIIAVPSSDPRNPSPHATGGALDIVLRYKQPTKDYVPGTRVPMGHVDGETSERINPDYFETISPRTEDAAIAQRNRRAYSAIMTGSVFGVNTDLVNNPTEWWHWGRGDQLSAKVHGDKAAYYSLAA
jgi:D-alanyl-D-alanine dipeptidase